MKELECEDCIELATAWGNEQRKNKILKRELKAAIAMKEQYKKKLNGITPQ